MKNLTELVLGVLIYAVILVVPIAAWIQHIVTCIAEEAWILMLFGAFFFPIGVIHGIGIWLGAF